MAIGRADTLLTEESIRRYEDEGFWRLPTFPSLLERNARECPTRVAYSDDHGSITWATLWEKCRRLAGHLMAAGVGRGDVVGVQLPNRIEFVIALGAIIGSAGAVAVARLLASTIPTLPTRDPTALAALILFLVVIALIACFVPAGRAARVDPLAALRHD